MPNEKSSVDNRTRHWQARREQNAANGEQGIALAWCDQARAIATTRARRGDHSAWTDLVATLEMFCSRFAGADTRRAVNQARHFEQRLAALEGAPPKSFALVWWDRARAVAGDQVDNSAWTDLALTLGNYCKRHGA
jgi:hypothetical protein